MLTVRQSFSRVRSVLRDARGVWFTGAVARIEHRGVLVFEEAYGVTRLDERSRPVYVDTAFDLASLTKIFVSTLALQTVERGLLSLDDPLTRWIPEWNGREHARITLRMLLSHTSGMNSGADYRQLLAERVAQYALERELVSRPGEGAIYSDLGFIAIGELLQRVRGASLASIAAGLGSSPFFRPGADRRPGIPATELD